MRRGTDTGTDVTQWLGSLRSALDDAVEPVTFFFRDDDAGWDDRRLFLLLRCFETHGLPVDVAVIPKTLTESLATRLSRCPGPVHLHQHGYQHLSYQTEGRKCEFGDQRTAAMQRHDIAEGDRVLREMLGTRIEPIFTPPWNRCTLDTARCLADLGFQVLSCESRAPRFNVEGLSEVPVTIDWFARSRGVRLSLQELGDSIKAGVQSGGPVGIMFHHAMMNADERHHTDALLALLASHPAVRTTSILEAGVNNDNPSLRPCRTR